MKRTIAAVAAGVVLGTAGVGGAATTGLITIPYKSFATNGNLACRADRLHGKPEFICFTRGNKYTYSVTYQANHVFVWYGPGNDLMYDSATG